MKHWGSKFGHGPRIAHRSYPPLPRIRRPLLVRVIQGLDAVLVKIRVTWRNAWDKVLAI
jgi:hypothetical protein